MRKTIIHLVCNAHIDPVWLWPWSAGLDEIVNTCASVCDLLERNPDVVFTRGESWVYEQIQKIDPRLFERIRSAINRGQWRIVGGWYVQPDCNLPHVAGLRQQIQLGRDFFVKAFNQFPRVAYNVDSFGHAPVIPGLMREFGQRYYVMMRPQEHELELPARLFRWRGYEDGPEVLTFRIAGAYESSSGLTIGHLEKSLTGLPKGVNHTMCFIGVGDHGGGPTQDMIEWCRAHQNAIDGATLKFSSPEQFFDAVVRQAGSAPLVTGELQPHAIGCYSVQRAVKTGIRRAEHALAQAEEALRMEPRLRTRYQAALHSAWQWVCFNHFHDTLGGTCLPRVYAQVDAQLGYARTVADEVVAVAVRRHMARLPGAAHQRLVIANYGGADFEGWIEHEPWLEWTSWQPDWSLVNEKGFAIPHQVLPSEAVFAETPRLLFRLAVKRGGRRVLRIVQGLGRPLPRPTAMAGGACSLVAARGGRLQVIAPQLRWSLPHLELLEDKSDTWSHGIDRFSGPRCGRVKWGRPRLVDQGALLSAWCVDGRIGKSAITAEVRRYSGAPFIEVRLRVMWLETHRVLRVDWPQAATIDDREDGVSGGALRRASDGVERPVHDRTLLRLSDGTECGVVFPDTFSLSGTARNLRLTLLRSAVMAHHAPHSGRKERRVISDQGVQEFTLRFYPNLKGGAPVLDADALGLHRPPVVADLTRGMPLRALRGQATARPLLRGGAKLNR